MQSHQLFIEEVWEYYHHAKRDLPWRHPSISGQFDPYMILVSEIMLQQTQVSRVIIKYKEFLQTFPSYQTLAAAPLANVLKLWSGLGYNRRARFLHEAARQLSDTGMPTTQDGWQSLPGVGRNTAGAVMAYAYNQPVGFIETNIRTVYIHHFFAGRDDVNDTELLAIVNETVDADNPREWYWALMDYGSFLKQTVGNVSKASAHYKKQTAFAGSKRQLRGQVLRSLAGTPKTIEQLEAGCNDSRLHAVLADLQADKLISQNATTYELGS